MPTALKILNAIFILFALYMGIKQGWAMLSGKPEMVAMFSKWNFGKTGLTLMGIATIAGGVMLLHPRTFVWGNYITAAGILLIIAFHLNDRDLKGVAIELPFLLLSLVILYLQYPFLGLFQRD
ncbi:DoxX-like family protein [Chryseolinea serpens]|uniref:DoxX-like family protein n=1 Tax=Chryseolinea serpens TaxID=947013 RepID=A0A1M5R2J1_9BACT|nr:DoxX family protein [Chryseolinea serpens]SHH20421.1 DoxX-like family protein [Chryseolinea serpens]